MSSFLSWEASWLICCKANVIHTGAKVTAALESESWPTIHIYLFDEAYRLPHAANDRDW